MDGFASSTVPQSPRAVSTGSPAWAMSSSPQAPKPPILQVASPRVAAAPLISLVARTTSGNVMDMSAASISRPPPAPLASPTMVHRVVGINTVPPHKQSAPTSPAQFFRQVGSQATPWVFLHSDKARPPQSPVQTHRSCLQTAQQVQTPVQSFRGALPSPRNSPAEVDTVCVNNLFSVTSGISGPKARSQSCTGSASFEAFGASCTNSNTCVGNEASSPGGHMREGTEVSSPSADPREGREAFSSNSCKRDGMADSDAEQTPINDETIKKLHKEIGSLRSELEALRGVLDEGEGRSGGQAMQNIRESTSIQGGRRSSEEEEEAATTWSPRDGGRARQSLGASAEQPPLSPIRLSMSTPPRPPSPQLARKPVKQGHAGPHRLSTTQSESLLQVSPLRQLSASSLSQQDLPVPRSPPGSTEHSDSIDDMWCAALRCFPNHPHWTMLKVSNGVYRLGSRTGKKILCQISHNGLQVRVGGGWMSANSFLQKYGPQYMGSRMGAESTIDSSTETPLNMERLLVPTKSWAKKIGISTSPDIREMRRPGEQLPKDCQASPR